MLRRSLLTKALKVAGAACLLLSAPNAFGYGSETHNGPEMILGHWSSANGDVIIGPQANITVNGDWYLTASRVYIHPSAIITGTGTIHLMSPAIFGQAAVPTELDGGGISIGCKLSLENGLGVSLTSINPAVTFPSTGIVDPGGAGTDNLRMSNNVNFNNPGAHLYLNNFDVVMNAGTPAFTYVDLNTIGFVPDPTPGAPSQAFVVTTGSGVIRKVAMAAGGDFVFPVGYSDYTPATVVNGPTVQDVNVAVATYAASAAAELFPQKGMGRSWKIYTSAGGSIAQLSLTHNTATNGAEYNPALAYISRQTTTLGTFTTPHSAAYGGPQPPTGEAGNPATMTSTPNSYYNHPTVLGTTATSAAANNIWYTKASGTGPGGLRLTVKVYLQGAAISAGGIPTIPMKNALQTAGPIPGVLPVNSNNNTGNPNTSAYPNDPMNSYAQINNPAGPAGPIVDWIQVELRSSNAAAPSGSAPISGPIVERQDYLLRTDGNASDAFGNITITMSSPEGNYYVAVRHRNHLGVMTPTTLALTNAGTTNVDFTTGSAYVTNAAAVAAPPQIQIQPGVYALWTGNVYSPLPDAGGNRILYSATPSDVGLVGNRVTQDPANGAQSQIFIVPNTPNTKVYETYDVDLDGRIRYSASPSDFSIVANNVTQVSFQKPTANAGQQQTYLLLIEHLP